MDSLGPGTSEKYGNEEIMLEGNSIAASCRVVSQCLFAGLAQQKNTDLEVQCAQKPRA